MPLIDLALAQIADGTNPSAVAYPRAFLAGLTLSNDGALPNTVLDVAAGEAADATNVARLVLPAFTKSTAAWAVGTGNGGMASGAAVAVNTWYHVFLIKRPDTRVTDIAFDTSATGANVAANTNVAYTLKRRIGAFKTAVGTTNILAFTQDGDYFRWSASVADVSAANPGTGAVTRTLTVPTGVNVDWLGAVAVADTTPGSPAAYISDLAASDEVPSLSNATVRGISGVAAVVTARVRTNTSAQVRTRLDSSNANTTLTMGTLGWIDPRGANA